MNNQASSKGIVPGDGAGNTVRYYKKDFWSNEGQNYSRPHYRLEKASRIINKLAGGEECALLDVGCGPATLMRLLNPNIQYHGIDIAIHDPAPNLVEADLLEAPIRFGDKQFDIVVAQGFFEYAGEFQSQKLAEISHLLSEGGTFIVSYVNFGHRHKDIYGPYNNVQPIDKFREDLARYFKINKVFPTSHNWNHQEPRRKLIRTINMHVNVSIPFISPVLAVEYFFICAPYYSKGSEVQL